MSTRHIEITSETIALGMLPFDLNGLDVLDIGCWTGGDLMVLGGLGATVTALEEHPVSAMAAARLCELSGCKAEIVNASLYADRPAWRQKFDVIYCSGVIYHVTDPLLFLRICFAYLKPGGRLVLETKSETGDGSFCGYSGTLERGWNWYAPSREALGRMLVDAGFAPEGIALNWRSIGRLLASARKDGTCRLPERAGFSRPGSWLEDDV
jgi:SAM-dependent methyltransferase